MRGTFRRIKSNFGSKEYKCSAVSVSPSSTQIEEIGVEYPGFAIMIDSKTLW
jgi:hypothetical protein